jgi:PAS domain S-box-containing protein
MSKEKPSRAMRNPASRATENVTEIRREKTLLRVKALQSAIHNSASFSYIATDAKGTIQIFNVGAEHMLGYAASDLLSKITPADITDPQELITRAEELSAEQGITIAPGFEALTFKASRGIEDIYELTYVRKDGSRFPAVVSVTALRDDRDAIIGYLLIGTDNTARKKAEVARRDSEEKYRTLFSRASDAIIVCDADGETVIDFNQAALELYGYTESEFRKLTSRDLDANPEDDGYATHAMSPKQTSSRFHRKADGRIFPVEFTCAAFSLKDKNLIMVLTRDMTEKLKAAEIEALKEREAMQRKLLSTVSHELRTPISVIKASAETLLLGMLKNEKTRSRFLQIIDKQADHLTGLVRQILLIAEFESGKTKPVTSSIRLTDLFRELLPGILMLAEKKRISITTQIEGKLIVRVDRSHLIGILQNLLDNAIKYNKNSGSIAILARRSDNGDVEISVRDTGIGISAEELPRIFQQFQRAQSVRELSIAGAGLGLYIVKNMVNMNGGRIWAESGEGKGTTFHFTLPLEGE